MPSHLAGGLEAWTQGHPVLPPRLRGDLASRLFLAWRALDPDAEKTRPDAGKGPEGYVCHATPNQSVSSGEDSPKMTSWPLHSHSHPLGPIHKERPIPA